MEVGNRNRLLCGAVQSSVISQVKERAAAPVDSGAAADLYAGSGMAGEWGRLLVGHSQMGSGECKGKFCGSICFDV